MLALAQMAVINREPMIQQQECVATGQTAVRPQAVEGWVREDYPADPVDF